MPLHYASECDRKALPDLGKAPLTGLILQGFKPRIFDVLKKFAGRWVEELPAVLWSLRTTPNRSMGLTPFFLTYGSKAVLPADLDYGVPRVIAFDSETAAKAQGDAMELLEEAR
jgi:hypothetical protein